MRLSKLSLPFILLFGSSFANVPTGVVATTINEYPSMTEGQVSISTNSRGTAVVDGQSLNTTDYYFIYTRFSNPDEESKTLLQVYYAVLVLDENGYSDTVGLNTYGSHSIIGHGTSSYQLLWFPVAPGEYAIRTFLISGLETPQILSPVATTRVFVNEKIAILAEGERNERVLVQNINLTDQSVHVIETFCVGSSYHDEVEATLHVGEHVSIAAVDVYFIGIEGDRAVFRFDANSSWENDECII